MAIIKNGKIHGKIGNYIYRVLNGVEIIQSYPRRIKVSDNTKVENLWFSLCAGMSSQIYQIVKDFALNIVHSRLYNNLTGIFRITLFASDSNDRLANCLDWTLLPSTEAISISGKHSDERILPTVCVTNEEVRVSISESSKPAYAVRYLPAAEYMELRCLLVHYDCDSKLARSVFEHSWDRELIGSITSARELEIDLAGLDQGLSH